MDKQIHNAIVSFIWGIADDCLRDVYVRGKYRDVILPMTVIRRLDSMLEDTKERVMRMKETLDKAGVTNQWSALYNEAGQAFCNASPFLLKDLTSRSKKQTLKADFVEYLDGFSPNVQEILESKFNKENNEEAGEHWTPRDVVELMADLIFVPVADQIKDATYSCYDGACGTGGMLTVAQDRLLTLAKKRGKEVSILLFGQELQPETYAICKADFILSNPPYGKSWKTDAEKLGGKKDILDSRIAEVHNGSSLFTGDAGSGESNARRYLIENDLVEAIIALPENMFYNTGIGTFI